MRAPDEWDELDDMIRDARRWLVVLALAGIIGVGGGYVVLSAWSVAPWLGVLAIWVIIELVAVGIDQWARHTMDRFPPWYRW